MPMGFMPMCGETWLCGTASFLVLWVAMAAAMMLPSLAPVLWRYHQMMEWAGARRNTLTGLMGLGYFFVWAALGIVAYPLAAALATVQTQLSGRAVPIALAGVVLLAGAVQLSAWKAGHLASCRAAPGQLPSDTATALRHGLRLGQHCVCSCAGLTAVMLISGMMDMRVMAAVTATITAERLAPAGERIAQGVGAMTIGAGLSLMAQAAGLG